METQKEKIARISRLLESETLKLTQSRETWMNYLSIAARLYKYDFKDSIIIAAHKPNASMCADFNLWSDKLHYKIKQGTKGIPLLREVNGSVRPYYVYDISDTERQKNSKKVGLWSIKPEHKRAVEQRFSTAFGAVDDNSNLESLINKRVDMLLDENIGSYIDEVEYNAKGSLVEELDRQNLAIRFRAIVEESVKIMVCERAGIARDIDEEALRYIGDFNTVDVITQLGTAVNDTASTVLREIEKEVRYCEKYLNNERTGVTNERNSKERNEDVLQYGQTGMAATVHRGERSDVQAGFKDNDLSSIGGDGSRSTVHADDVGTAQADIPQGEQKGNISEADDKRSLGTPRSNGQGSEQAGRYADERNGSTRGDNGRTETAGSDEMGRTEERSETESPRDSIGTGNIRINTETAEDKTPAVSSVIQTIELEKYSAPDENGRVKRIGMATLGEVFEQLEAHLKANNMLPDEYFDRDLDFDPNMEVPEYAQFVCHPYWGSSEGIYLDITMETANGVINFATGKTLEDNYAAFKRMGDIATECNIMLNSNGRRIERDGISTPEYIKQVMAKKAEQEKATDVTEYKIYQLKDDPELRGLRFEPYSRLDDTSDPDMNNYDLVYEGKLENINGYDTSDILETLYKKFNTDRPDDFTGHSLSMSDIVVLNDKTAHYVDDVGFAEVPEFLTERIKDLSLEAIEETDEIYINADAAQVEELKAHFSNNGYDIKWADDTHFTADKNVTAYIETILADRDIAYSVNAELPKSEQAQKENKNTIGNTPYRFIAKKTYATMPQERAELVAKRFENEGVKFSGKINDNGSITLTYSKNDYDECQAIINDVAARQVVEEHRQTTRELYKPIGNTDLDNLEAIMFDVVQGYIDDNDLDVKINDLTLYGSRSRGIENENSDIDIVIEYDGTMKEDALFNIFNEEGYTFAGLKVDFNPIHEEETGTLEEYLPRVNKYLDEQIRETGRAEKPPEKADKSDIIGNTVFKYIPKKHYEKFDKDLGISISNAFTEKGIKHSGKINGDTVTLTMSKNDLDKCNEIIAQVKTTFEAPAAENTVVENAVDEQTADEKTYTLPDIVKNNMPDPDITIEDRNNFGYTYEVMLPLMQDTAIDIWENKNLPVYLLYDDNTESMAESIEDIENHSGIFGIETQDWERYISTPEYQKMQTAKEIAAQPVTDEEHIRGIPKSIVIKALVHGSGFANGKFRLEELYKSEKDTKTRIAALKKEYGTGGYGNPADSVGDIRGIDHDGKGLGIRWIGENGELSGLLKWNDVDKVLKELIANDIYITSAERERYEREMFVKAQIDLMSEGDIISVNGENFTFVKKDDVYRIEVVPENPDSDFCYNTTYNKNIYYIDNFRLERNDFRINAAGKEEKTVDEPAPQTKTDDKIYRFYHGREVGEFKMMFQPNQHDFTTVYFNADTIRIAARIATENGETDKNLFFKMIESYGKRDRVSDDTLFYMTAKNEFDNNIALMEGLSEENMRTVLNFAQTGKLELSQQAQKDSIAEQPTKGAYIIAHNNFVRLQELYPEIFSGEHTAENYKSGEGIDGFLIELEENNLNLANYTMDLDDFVFTPSINYYVDFENQTVIPKSYEMSSKDIYKEYQNNSDEQNKCNEFTASWLGELEGAKSSYHLAWHQENVFLNNENHNITVRYDENGAISEIRGDNEAVEAYKDEKGIFEQEPTLPAEDKTIHFYKYGDFYEAFGTDAENAAIILDLHITKKNSEKMVGVPEFSVDNYIKKLEDEGFSVLISDTTREQENALSPADNKTDILADALKKHKTIYFKDSPKEEYYAKDARDLGIINQRLVWGEDGYQLRADTNRGENMYLRDMGASIDEIISYLQSANMELDHIEENVITPIETAKQLISEYIADEFSTEDETATPDFSDLISIPLGYTTADSPRNEEISVEPFADLINSKVYVFVGDVLAKETYFETSDELEFYLANMTFGELTDVDDEMWDKYYTVTEKEAADRQVEEKPKTAENFILTEEKMNVGSHKEQFRANIEAIKLLKQLEADKIQATPEQQDILGKYMGWGGLADAFDEKKDSWAAEYTELKELLTPEEYKSAKATVLNSHYTSPTIINVMYKTLERMGFNGGTVLEPSMGVGNFFGAMPESLKDSKLYGVELDDLTGRFAKQLYPDANVQIKGFQKTAFNSNSFDLAVGNVPFGNYRIYDNELQCHDLIHDYFFKKALDKVHPGGVVAFITSMGTMDKTNDAVRKYLAERAELLGAVRLPDTAMNNANTEVTADIIFLKKRDEVLDFEKNPELMPDWVNTKPNAEGYVINSYFADHPEAVVGELDRVSGPYGPKIICKLGEGQDFAETLEKALSTVTGEFEYDELANSVEEEIDPEYLEVPYEGHRNFCYCLVDDKIYFRENQMMIPQKLEGKRYERMKGMIQLSNVLQELIRQQREDFPDDDIRNMQRILGGVYNDFTQKFGLVSSDTNMNLFKEDDTCELLSSLEILNEDGELERKADIFTKRTIVPYVPPTHADTVSDALTISISEKAKVDLAYMSQLCGKTAEEILDEMQGVIFENPVTGKYETADEYLSGDVREKLRVASLMAESNPKYKINVESLQAVQPEELTPKEISVQLCSTWIPVKYYEQFMYELLDTPRRCRTENNYYDADPFAAGKNPTTISIQYDERSATFGISNKGSSRADSSSIKVSQTYGTSRVNAYKILEDTLNNKTVVVKDYFETPDGKKKAVVNQKETMLAQEKQEDIKQRFREWIWQDPERTEDLCRIYNEKFNSIRPREYDGSHIRFVGMNPNIELLPHQKNAIAHTLYGGNTLLAHTMGAGKTFEMVASAMEAKRLGLCRKSLICVPKHIVNQFGKEFLQLYPNANILVASEKDFSKQNRRRFFSRIATGNYDAVIISHSQLEKLPLSPERRIDYVQSQIDEITAAIEDMRHMEGKRGFTVKQLETEKANLEDRIKKYINEEKYDTNVFFEDMGFDRMFIDEGHYFKNRQFISKMGRNIAGINAASASQRATDLAMKIQYMDEITGCRGSIIATGTPLSNSMSELYIMQSYLQADLLKQRGLHMFDAWAANFGETQRALELAPEGKGYQIKTRFSKFFNLPELMNLFRLCADIKMPEDLNLPVPTAHYEAIKTEASKYQSEMVDGLAERAKAIRDRKVLPEEDNMLRVTNEGRKLALDQRLMDPLLPDDPNSKVNKCIEQVHRIYTETKETLGTQMIFCDLSTPKGNGEFNVYDDIKQKLINMGVPENEVVFIHDAKNDAQKAELFAKVNNGEIRILIGSTQRMGAGTNCQKLLKAVHHLDCPWRPADLAQRDGRIIRQGNTNKEVNIYNYVTSGTFDAYLFQLVENKQKFISQIMTSKSPQRVAEDVDEAVLNYAQIKALAAGDERIKRKMDLDMELTKLRTSYSNFLDTRRTLQADIVKKYPEEIHKTMENITAFENDIVIAQSHKAEKFAGMTVKGKVYTDKKEAGEALIETVKRMGIEQAGMKIGEYRGFEMKLEFNKQKASFAINLQGALAHKVDIGNNALGNIMRLDNELAELPKYFENNKIKLEDLQNQLKTAKEEVEKPFPKLEEMREMERELNDLNRELSLDNPEESEILPETGETEHDTNRSDDER